MGRKRTGRLACSVRHAPPSDKRGGWLVDWVDVAGVRRNTGGFPTKAKAHAHLDYLRLSGQTRTRPHGSQIALTQFAAVFFAGRQVSAKTNWVDAHRWRLHLAPRLGHLTLTGLTYADAKTYRDGRLAEGASRPTVNRELALLSAMLTEAHRQGLIPEHPLRGLLKQSTERPRRRRVLTGFEQRLLLQAAAQIGRQVHLAILIPLDSTIRPGKEPGASLSLRWDWIEWTEHQIVLPVTKSGHRQIVAVGPDLYAALMAAYRVRRDEIHVFPSPGAACGHLTTIHKPFKRALEIAGLPRTVRYYDLRHTTITGMLNAGTPIQVVSRAAGHRSIATTARYAHSTDLAERAAVESLSRKRRGVAARSRTSINGSAEAQSGPSKKASESP